MYGMLYMVVHPDLFIHRRCYGDLFMWISTSYTKSYRVRNISDALISEIICTT